MRAVVALLLLATPLAAAAPSGVHLAWMGDGYAVTFSDDATPHVRAGGADVPAQATALAHVWTARLPADATGYEIDGRAFSIAPRPPAGGTLRVAFVADMGTGPNETAVLDAIARAKPDLLLVGGDLSYANGDASVWTDWLASVEPLASRVPMMTALGNHETWCDGSGSFLCADEQRAYGALFPMPNAPHRYYAFDEAGVRFVALDTEAYHPDPALASTDPKAQLAFLGEALRGDAWSVVYFHRPLYSTNQHDDGADADAQRDLVPALEAGGADLVLYGHAHAYERTWPLLHGKVVAQRADATRGEGIVYVDSGGGGRSLYDEFGATQPWSAKRIPTFEFVLLTITPTKISGQAIGVDGQVLDAFSIEKPASAPKPTTPVATATLPAEVVSTPHRAPDLGVAAALLAVAAVAVARRLRP